MRSITAHYGIVGTVPFLDIDVRVDNKMFVDPHAIRLQDPHAPYVAQANHATETFFLEVAKSALSRDHSRGLYLLQHFEEPWETRLGLARQGFRGHGGADDVGTWIWESLINDLEALLRIGLLRQIEDLPMFVNGIDRDITSDITTRIIFSALADFTAEIVHRYPEFSSGAHRLEAFQRQVWDPIGLAWTYKQVMLPVAAGKPLLLIPRDWARPTLLMSAGRYYETSVLGFAQLEQAVVLNSGKLLKISKDDLKLQAALGRGRVTNLRVTQRAQDNEEDLISQFKAFVDSRYTALDDNEINRRIA